MFHAHSLAPYLHLLDTTENQHNWLLELNLYSLSTSSELKLTPPRQYIVYNPDWQLATTAVLASCGLSDVTEQRHHTLHVKIPLIVPLSFLPPWSDPMHLLCWSCVHRQLHDMTTSRDKSSLPFEGPNEFTVPSLTTFMQHSTTHK